MITNAIYLRGVRFEKDWEMKRRLEKDSRESRAKEIAEIDVQMNKLQEDLLKSVEEGSPDKKFIAEEMRKLQKKRRELWEEKMMKDVWEHLVDLDDFEEKKVSWIIEFFQKVLEDFEDDPIIEIENLYCDHYATSLHIRGRRLEYAWEVESRIALTKERQKRKALENRADEIALVHEKLRTLTEDLYTAVENGEDTTKIVEEIHQCQKKIKDQEAMILAINRGEVEF